MTLNDVETDKHTNSEQFYGNLKTRHNRTYTIRILDKDITIF